MLNPKLLVISLGNPLPKYASLHSAGHFVLHGLPKILRQPAVLKESKFGGQSCMVSRGPKYILIQSPTLMNVSGSFVQKAWQEMKREHGANNSGLVIIHDELEKEFGQVQSISWSRSARGHNGIKSIKKFLNPAQDSRSLFARIAIGIGRPQQRDSASVSNYVLAPIGSGQRKLLVEECPYGVFQCLTELEEQWDQEQGNK